MGKWFKVHSVSSAIGRSMVLILFMASLIAVVAMVTLFYSVPDAKAINLSGSLRMQAYRMAYEIEQGQPVLGRLDQFEQTLHARELQETQRWITPASLRRTYGEVLLQWQIESGRHRHDTHRRVRGWLLVVVRMHAPDRGSEYPQGCAAPSPPPEGGKETWGGPAFP